MTLGAWNLPLPFRKLKSEKYKSKQHAVRACSRSRKARVSFQLCHLPGVGPISWSSGFSTETYREGHVCPAWFVTLLRKVLQGEGTRLSKWEAVSSVARTDSPTASHAHLNWHAKCSPNPCLLAQEACWDREGRKSLRNRIERITQAQGWAPECSQDTNSLQPN